MGVKDASDLQIGIEGIQKNVRHHSHVSGSASSLAQNTPYRTSVECR